MQKKEEKKQISNSKKLQEKEMDKYQINYQGKGGNIYNLLS